MKWRITSTFLDFFMKPISWALEKELNYTIMIHKLKTCTSNDFQVSQLTSSWSSCKRRYIDGFISTKVDSFPAMAYGV